MVIRKIRPTTTIGCGNKFPATACPRTLIHIDRVSTEHTMKIGKYFLAIQYIIQSNREKKTRHQLVHLYTPNLFNVI